MKNIHLVPTDKPGRLHLGGSGLVLCDLVFNNGTINSQHLYITSDEEIKDGEYGICLNLVREGLKSHLAVFKMDCDQRHSIELLGGQKRAEILKVIMATDQDLIKDGVQAIDDEFLEWFVMNPSCEFVKTELVYDYEEHSELTGNPREEWSYYKIIISQEEPKDFLSRTEFDLLKQQAIEEEMEEFDKQETLEEAAEKYRKHWVNNTNSTISDTFMAGAKWQSERIPSIIEEYLETAFISKEQGYMNPQKWFEQFKKK